MKIIAIASTKGGVGKSTIAINLATYAIANGYNVLLADGDTQSSSLFFSANREELHLPIIPTKSLESESDLIDSIAQNKYDLMIIDCGGRDTEMFRASLIYADIIVTPVQGGQFDLWGTTDTFDLLQEAFSFRKRKGKVIAVMNQVRKNTNLFKEAHEALAAIVKEYRFVLANTVLSQREDFRQSIVKGKGVYEYRRTQPASQEIESLFNEIISL